MFIQTRYTVEPGTGAYAGRWIVIRKADGQRITDEATEAQARATAAKCAKAARELDTYQDWQDRTLYNSHAQVNR